MSDREPMQIKMNDKCPKFVGFKSLNNFVRDEIFRRRIREYEVKTMWIVLNREDIKYTMH